MKMISELFIKQKTWFNFVSFLTEQSLCRWQHNDEPIRKEIFINFKPDLKSGFSISLEELVQWEQ
mgnify:CR=1 FL=1